MSRHISLLPAGGAAGWAQIATATPVGVGAVDFTGISSSYSDLLIRIEGISHDNGSSTQLQLALSADGATYSPAANISQTASQSATFYGAVYIPMYRAKCGLLLAAMANLFSQPATASTSNPLAWSLSGGIAALRVLLAAGAFDAGTITLYGR